MRKGGKREEGRKGWRFVMTHVVLCCVVMGSSGFAVCFRDEVGKKGTEKEVGK